jgi:uncharacterized membrane protein
MDENKQKRLLKVIKPLLILIAVVLLGVWLWFTPPGLFGKADAVGYSVCHQIPERSFQMGERSFPLCARCSGMYLGAFVTFLYQLKRKRAGELPPKKILFILGFLLLLFAIDGGNSYLHFFKNAPTLYEPNNTFRLITGLGLGIGMAAILYPIFNQSIWADWMPISPITSMVDLFKLALVNTVIFLIINSGNILIMFSLALISSGTIIFMLSMIYTILITMLFKKENSFQHLKEIKWMALAGFCCAIFQIGAMDMMRFWLTGTWSGFSL